MSKSTYPKCNRLHGYILDITYDWISSMDTLISKLHLKLNLVEVIINIWYLFSGGLFIKNASYFRKQSYIFLHQIIIYN